MAHVMMVIGKTTYTTVMADSSHLRITFTKAIGERVKPMDKVLRFTTTAVAMRGSLSTELSTEKAP